MMNEKAAVMLRRMEDFAISVICLYKSFPKTEEARIIGRQVIRSGSSPGAHYAEACRPRSKSEFISKIEVAVQELNETAYWLRLAIRADISTKEQCESILKEADELMAILSKSVKTIKAGMK